METLTLADAMQRALYIVLLSALPLLLVAMGVGLVVSILQTATSIQEQTLTFIPKMLAMFAMLLFFGPYIFSLVCDFTILLFTNMYQYVN